MPDTYLAKVVNLVSGTNSGGPSDDWGAYHHVGEEDLMTWDGTEYVGTSQFKLTPPASAGVDPWVLTAAAQNESTDTLDDEISKAYSLPATFRFAYGVIDGKMDVHVAEPPQPSNYNCLMFNSLGF